MTYLLIHEDGTVEQTGIGETFALEANLQGVADGYLDIIRVRKQSTTFERLTPLGTWVAV